MGMRIQELSEDAPLNLALGLKVGSCIFWRHPREAAYSIAYMDRVRILFWQFVGEYATIEGSRKNQGFPGRPESTQR